jgi:uncharacterized protein YxeA
MKKVLVGLLIVIMAVVIAYYVFPEKVAGYMIYAASDIG